MEENSTCVEAILNGNGQIIGNRMEALVGPRHDGETTSTEREKDWVRTAQERAIWKQRNEAYVQEWMSTG